MFKTKADVRQHVKNWHTLEKSERREMKLLHKLEKTKSLEEQIKKLKMHNKLLTEENNRLRLACDRGEGCGEMGELKSCPKRPIPPFTQYLQEQYALLRDEKGKKTPFCEFSKQVARQWHGLPEEQRESYLVGVMSTKCK